MSQFPPHEPPDAQTARPATPPVARPGRRRARRLAAVAALVVLGMAVVVAGFVAWEVRRFRAIPRVEVASVEPAGDGAAANWLLVGTDSRDGIEADDPNAGAFLGEEVLGTRTDTILVARVDPEAVTVDLLSIPRDLWVTIAGREEQGRINGAYDASVAGPERLTATVERSLGIDVHHYVEVDFVGFREVVDALGGVAMQFDHPARDQRSGFVVDAAGAHDLDGDQALALARSRAYEELIDGAWQADPTGDLGRTDRQRALLARIVEAAGRAAGPTGVVTADRVLAAGADNLVLDGRTDLGAVVSLVRTGAAVGAEGITSHQLPVADHRTSAGAQVLVLREGEAEVVLARFR